MAKVTKEQVKDFLRKHPDNANMRYWMLNRERFEDHQDTILAPRGEICGTTLCVAGAICYLGGAELVTGANSAVVTYATLDDWNASPSAVAAYLAGFTQECQYDVFYVDHWDGDLQGQYEDARLSCDHKGMVEAMCAAIDRYW